MVGRKGAGYGDYCMNRATVCFFLSVRCTNVLPGRVAAFCCRSVFYIKQLVSRLDFSVIGG